MTPLSTAAIRMPSGKEVGNLSAEMRPTIVPSTPRRTPGRPRRRPFPPPRKGLGVVLTALFLFEASSVGAEEDLGLADLSLEQLMDIEVSLPSRRAERVSRTPSAVIVITEEDIRRSGAMTIPDLLRMVPGLHVAQIDAARWAVTSRGFNGRFANKLLVLIDGRSVYTPLFSGVYWNVQNQMIEDVERIEVIRGPGSAMWGANAVNGVINIITKNAEETPGGLVKAGVGSEEKGFGGLRYGNRIGNAFWRVYAEGLDRDSGAARPDDDAGDEWEMSHGGFRVDWSPTPEDILTFIGALYDGGALERVSFLGGEEPTQLPVTSEIVDADTDLAGGSLLARWDHVFSQTSDSSLQVYFDRTERTNLLSRDILNAFDVDFQHRFALGDHQEIMWGAGYRFLGNHNDGTFDLHLDPTHRDRHVWSAFLQHQLDIVEDRLRLTLGAKIEHNTYTDWEHQPSARLLWTPCENHTLWAAVSRSIRTPSRAERDIRIYNAGLEDIEVAPGTTLPARSYLTLSMGSDDFDSERVYNYEVGYRLQPTPSLFFDFTAFYNDYDNLRSLEPIEVDMTSAVPIVITAAANDLFGETYGFETSADWLAKNWWRWRLGYSYLQVKLHSDPDDALLPDAEEAEQADPEHQVFVRSYLDLPADCELNVGLRYVDDLPALGVDGYLSADLAFFWRPTESLTLSLVGRNLLDKQHPEYVARQFIPLEPTEIERGVYGKLIWRF